MAKDNHVDCVKSHFQNEKKKLLTDNANGSQGYGV